MAGKSLLCLSSGLTPQYRLDILRLLALPTGTHIRFRYAEEIVSPSLRKALSENHLNVSVLLAHVDCNESARREDGTCPITPCRYATIVNSTKLGEFFFLNFRLEDFAPCTDLDNFQKQVAGARPHWANGQTTGEWCFESSAGQSCQRIPRLDGWQDVVRFLATSEDFAKEPFFFAVRGIFVRGESEPAKPNARGEFALRAERDHFVEVFHFHPEADKRGMASSVGTVQVDVSEPQLAAITSPRLPVASPYDLKTFHFRTGTGGGGFASLFIRTTVDGGQPLASQPELFIPLKIRTAWVKTAVLVIVIGGLLFVQQYLAAAAKGPVSREITLGLLSLAGITALIAVLGLKKPV